MNRVAFKKKWMIQIKGANLEARFVAQTHGAIALRECEANEASCENRGA